MVMLYSYNVLRCLLIAHYTFEIISFDIVRCLFFNINCEYRVESFRTYNIKPTVLEFLKMNIKRNNYTLNFNIFSGINSSFY